jgi:hypothetical protein
MRQSKGITKRRYWASRDTKGQDKQVAETEETRQEIGQDALRTKTKRDERRQNNHKKNQDTGKNKTKHKTRARPVKKKRKIMCRNRRPKR